MSILVTMVHAHNAMTPPPGARMDSEGDMGYAFFGPRGAPYVPLVNVSMVYLGDIKERFPPTLTMLKSDWFQE